jgi:hypothetical protein
VDEHVFAAFITLDEAEALLGIEEFDLALTGADYLGRHPAATGGAAARGAETAARPTAAAAAIVIASETIAAAESTASPIVTTTAKAGAAVHEWIETLFPETVPFVAPLAATPSIVTHEPNAPSIRPQSSPGDADENRRIEAMDNPRHSRRPL